MSKYGDYVLMTDSTCDLPDKIAAECGLLVLPMVFLMEEKVYHHYLDAREMSLEEFYGKLKSGVQSQTTQISYSAYIEYFEPYLRDGKDIVYICFTSGLSGTYNTSKIAARELLERYPDRSVTIVDSLCASAGQGLLMYHVGMKYKNEKPSSEELVKFAEELKLKVGHWFVVDDIDLLKRGGRISAVTATFAKALQIKPVLSVDENGKLVNVGKTRGSAGVYSLLESKMKRDAEDLKNQTIMIAHADNIDGAKELRKRVKSQVKDVIICDIGPVIGTHVGSGMLAVLFLGKRNME